MHSPRPSPPPKRTHPRPLASPTPRPPPPHLLPRRRPPPSLPPPPHPPRHTRHKPPTPTKHLTHAPPDINAKAHPPQDTGPPTPQLPTAPARHSEVPGPNRIATEAALLRKD